MVSDVFIGNGVVYTAMGTGNFVIILHGYLSRRKYTFYYTLTVRKRQRCTMTPSQNTQWAGETRRGKHHGRRIVLGFLLPSSAQLAPIAETGHRAFDFPAAWSIAHCSNAY